MRIKAILHLLQKLHQHKFFYPFLLVGAILLIYYPALLFQKVPFPGDLLVSGYSPWFDHFKTPIKNTLLSDVFSQLFIWKYLSIESLKHGQWPLWNPYSLTGNPLLANYQSAALYPLNVLLLMPKYFGWSLYIAAQTLISGLTMYLLLSRWVKSPVARLSGSLIFALGGLMTTWVELGTAVHAMAWLPLSIYCIDQYATSLKVRYLVILTFTLTLTTLAGHAQITTYSYVTVFLFVLFRNYTHNLSQYFFRVLFCGIAILSSIAITMPQLLTSYELLQRSIRATDNYTKEFNYGLIPLKEVFKFFVGNFYGTPINRNYWGVLNYFETSSFIGSISLPLLLFFIFVRKTQIMIFFLGLLSLFVILTFQNPLSELIYQIKIPLLTSSYASRGLFMINFCLAILVSFSINEVLIGKKYPQFGKSVIYALAMFTGMILGIVITYFIVSFIQKSAVSKFYIDFFMNDHDYALTNFIVTLRNIVIPVGLNVIFLIITGYVIYVKKFFSLNFREAFFGIFIVSALLFDLGRYFLQFNPFVPQKFVFPITPTIEYLLNQSGVFRLGRENAEVLPPNTWAAYHLQSFEGYDPLYFVEYAKFMKYLNNGTLDMNSLGRYAELTSKKYDSPFLNAANVKYFIAILRDQNGLIPGDLIDYRLKEAGYLPVFKNRGSVVLENPNALPRAYLAKSIVVAEDLPKLQQLLNIEKINPSQTTILSENINFDSISGTGDVNILSYNPNEVRIKTKTDQNEILVLSDQFDDGWKATINDIPTKIVKANLVFRAIQIPPGQNKITFYYHPKSFYTGLKITFTTVLLLALVIIISIKKKIF